MANVTLKNINKIYDNKVQAVFDFNLDIKDKEFIVFVGPSGCGKTTTLRMIAGLEDITSGELYIDEKDVTTVEAKKRDIAMVFQNYALYPHMSVYQNLSFSLENMKVDKKIIDQKVHEAARILGIEEYLDRKPKALSGGQRQRVALGRAIVRDAKVYLMDEPLSNLDAKLRIQMRTELIRLHKNIEATTIYVTHDQTEAMTMADRIVVMNNGYIQQVGTPEEVYKNPVNLFVAGFLGSPQINFLNGTYKDGYFVLESGRKIEMLDMNKEILQNYEGKELILGVRPEDIYVEDIVKTTYPSAVFDYEIDVTEMLGHEYILYGKCEGLDLTMRTSLRVMAKKEKNLQIAFDLSKIHVFDKETEKEFVLMKLEDFKPISEAVVHQSKINHPKYPVIDFHTHMGKLLLGENYQELFDTGEYVNQLRNWGVMKAVNLDGFYGKDLDDMKDKIDSYQDYFINFMWIDFSCYDDPDFENKTKKLILENYEKGARGIKLWKNISLYLKDVNGKAIRCDDARFDIIYDMAAELDIPVLMHIADPVAFFKKMDEYNERIEELSECPNWNFSDSSKYMTFHELMEMQENVIKNHPNTKFVIAHVGSYAENLGWVSQQLHKYPNMNVDIAARIAELGRVPYTARKFFIENQNQIVLGTDSHPLSLGFHTITYRMMETWDEYFAYQPEEKPGQGRWAIYGLHLPDEVLQKIYYKNACRLLKIDEKAVEREYEKLFEY